MNTKKNKKSRHGRYKVGTCKLTVTVDNEDKVRVHRDAVRRGFPDDSAYLRALIHEAVYDVLLEPEDYEKLKAMSTNQENA